MLVEKPLPDSLNATDLQEMIEAGKKAGKQFMDGTMWLHSTRTKALEKDLPSIGNVVRVNSAFSFKYPDEEWLHGGNGRTEEARGGRIGEIGG